MALVVQVGSLSLVRLVEIQVPQVLLTRVEVVVVVRRGVQHQTFLVVLVVLDLFWFV
jgi:hypothetical protein